MTKEEAKTWLSGERSMMNIVPCEPFETWEARIAQADAEMTRRAYWLLRAHSENLIDDATVGYKNREKRIQEVALQLVARSSANVPYAFKLAEEYVAECERRENEAKKGGER
jgi:hypothetical protein